MFKKIFFGLFLILTVQQLFAQVSGVLVDSKNKNKVNLASISLIRPTDSILLKSTRSNNLGQFNLAYSKDGEYELLISHPFFGDRKMAVTIQNGKADLKEISLTPRSVMLEEIVVRQKGSVKIKGDTTQFIADSFKVDVNASVEDLLKQLPGLTVDKDGTITAQGEQVQKVLVDGEEFFGDDPTVATRNLQANIVDKVEIFDDKSEQAKFTGFDDGQKEKTVNLKLKKDKNKGTFGKVQGSTDAQKFYDNSAMINSFKNKRKFSVYGINSNTGTAGLNWNDRNNFGSGGGDRMMDDDNGMMFMMQDDEEDNSQYNGVGLPSVTNIGLHYSNKWLDNKHHLNVSANSRNNQIGIVNQTKNTQFIGPITLASQQDKVTEKTLNNLSANVRYETNIDTATMLVVKLNGRVNDIKNEVETNATNINGLDTTSTTSNIRTTDGTDRRYGADVTLKKRLKKKGRTYSINAGTSFNDNNSDGFLIGTSNLRGDVIPLDQRKTNTLKSNQSNAKIIYTEPLKKDGVLAELSYNFGINNSEQNKNTLVKNGTDEYSLRIDSLSNQFQSNVTSHTPGIKFRFNNKKWNYGFGSSVRMSHFNQKDIIRNMNYDYNQLNFLPNANANYRISQFSNLRMSYNGSTSQPTIQQMQPFNDNNDPLNLIIGNPNLKQSFSQSINLNYWNYKALKDKNTWAGFWAGQDFNDIVDSSTYDVTSGRTIASYANINGGYNVSVWAGVGAKIKSSKFKYQINGSANTSRTPSYVFGAKSFGNTFAIDPSFEISYNNPKKYTFRIEENPTYNFYSNKALNQNNRFWGNTIEADASVYLTKKMVLRSDIEYFWQQARPPFTTNFNRTLWNASIRHRFLKQNNLEAFMSVNDILNNNVNYNRSTYANVINETRNNTIRRFFLVGAVWNFSYGPISKMKDLVDEEEF